MIELKLTFSTVAEAAAFLAGRPVGDAVAKAEVAAPKATPAPAAAPKPAATPKPAAAPSSSAAPAASPASSPAPAASAPAGDAIPYEVLQKAVFGVAQLGADQKAKVLAIAGEMGAATFKELPADKWAEAKRKVDALHAELTGEVA